MVKTEPGGMLRAVLNALPAMVGYWDTNLQNRIANDAYVDYFGFTPEQMRGLQIREVLGETLYGQNLPYIEGVLRGEPQLFDRTIIDTAGCARYTQASYLPDIVDGEIAGFFVLVTDITARREAELALEASEERFRILVERVEDYAIVMLSPEGLVLTWNDGAERINGYRANEILGKHISAFFLPEDVKAHKPEDELAVAATLGHVEEEGWRLGKDGKHFWANVTITAFHNPDGTVRGFAKITRDLTERREAELKLRASQARFAALVERSSDVIMVLNDDYASTRHARLSQRGSEWYVEDLGSTNGTYLDRAKVTTAVRVPMGTPVRIGKTVIELRP